MKRGGLNSLEGNEYKERPFKRKERRIEYKGKVDKFKN
jgi:hypothetical protein